MTEAPLADELELGPIDYIVVEYADGRPTGAALPYLFDLVERGLVRILDVAMLVKDNAEDFHAVTLSDVEAAEAADLGVFADAVTGIIGEGDLAEVARIIEPGAAAAILVYENTWAAPFATALRRSGGQLVASGRIPASELVAALELLDAQD